MNNQTLCDLRNCCENTLHELYPAGISNEVIYDIREVLILDVFYVSSSFHSVSSCTLRFAEALEMDDLPCPQELDGVIYIRVIAEPQDVIISQASLLLGGQIFRQVGNHVAGRGYRPRRPRKAGCSGGVDACCVIHKIGVKACGSDVLVRQISRKLMHDRTHHFKMPQFLGAD